MPLSLYLSTHDVITLAVTLLFPHPRVLWNHLPHPKPNTHIFFPRPPPDGLLHPSTPFYSYLNVYTHAFVWLPKI